MGTRANSFLPALTAFCTACAASDAPRVATQHTDSAGVDIAATAGTRRLQWKLEPQLTISSEESSGAGAFDPVREGVKADAAGHIYVLDFRGVRVIVFDEHGKFVRTLGKRGGGPGEMALALALAVHPDGTAAVFDAGKHHLVRFGADGSILPEEDFSVGFFGGNFAITSVGYFYDGHGQNAAGERTSSVSRYAQSIRTNVLELVDPPTKPIQLQSCHMGFSGMPPLFAPSLVWAARDDMIAVAGSAAYDIQVFDGASAVRRVRRDVLPRPATAALAAKEVGDAMKVRTDDGMRVCKSEEVAEQRGFAPVIPAVGAIALAPNGELWVQQRGVKGESMPIDVFSATGDYLGTLATDTPFPAAFLSDGRVVAVSKDDMDVGRIVIYSIRRS